MTILDRFRQNQNLSQQTTDRIWQRLNSDTPTFSCTIQIILVKVLKYTKGNIHIYSEAHNWLNINVDGLEGQRETEEALDCVKNQVNDDRDE